VHQRLSNVQYNCWNSVLQEQVKAHDTNRTAFESAANNGSAPLYVNVAITVDKELRWACDCGSKPRRPALAAPGAAVRSMLQLV
jgi:hypothetical protein